MKNKKTMIAIVSVIAVILVLIGVTYAYWLVTKEQQGENVISSACLDIEMSGQKDINLPSQYPLADEDGMELVPFEFIVTNNCKANIDFQINLETLGVEENTIIPSAIKVALNNDVSLLSEKAETSPTLSDAYTARKLLVGTLGYADESSPLPPSKVYYLRLWIDKDAPVSEQNKMFTSKITVTVGQNIFNPYKEGTLAYNLISKYDEDGPINILSNFNAPTVDNEAGMYKAFDDLGTSYYLRGDVTNNYVKFGTYSEDIIAYRGYFPTGTDFNEVATLEECTSNTLLNCVEYIYANEGDSMYWRIARINGDGTIRLVYDGIEKVANGTNHKATIGLIEYNTNFNDVKHVGYTYESTDAEGSTIQADSTIKAYLDNWYNNNLKTNYGKYIADGIFCNDRTIGSVNGITQYFAAHDRLSVYKPQLICANKNDRYTVDDITIGNGYLSNPVGLLSADEVLFAGGSASNTSSSNNTYYLSFEENYWTSSPSTFLSGPYIYSVKNGWIDGGAFVRGYNGARPVINLKADVKFTGDGSFETPYEIVME